MLVEDRALARHPSDGGGRAWIASIRDLDLDATLLEPPLPAGSRARFEIVYEAGPLGVAEGGSVFLQTSPFWGWDTPQVQWPYGPGLTEVSTEAEGVTLAAETVDQNLLAVRVEGRALDAGERITLVFGAGPAGATVDRFAERGERLYLAVDGDGDGIRGNLAESPRVDIGAGRPGRLVVWLPSTARTGQPIQLRAAVLDVRGNAGVEVDGPVQLALEGPEGVVELPPRLALDGETPGVGAIEIVPAREGVIRVSARFVFGPEEEDFLEARSNPMLVSDSAPRILWGDLHGHSQLSDGTGTPDDFYRYARDVAALEVASLTDHDHWGMDVLDDEPELWEQIKASAQANYAPGRFVSIAGYEWTSWLHGHRHVLHFGEDAPLWSSLDPETTTPAQLWQAIGDRPTLTFAHHSAGGPVATNWRYAPPPSIEPVTEVASVHGSSEALDAPGRIYDPQPGNFVRDVLDAGVRFGFIGSGDSHDGHPGLTHLASAHGGLAAIFAEEPTREAVRAALLARRCYATNGARIWLRFALDGRPMGSVVAGDGGRPHALEIAVLGTAPIERVELVRSGAVLAPIEGGGETSFSALVELPALGPGEYVYARVLQSDGGAAWTTPIYAE